MIVGQTHGIEMPLKKPLRPTRSPKYVRLAPPGTLIAENALQVANPQVCTLEQSLAAFKWIFLKPDPVARAIVQHDIPDKNNAERRFNGNYQPASPCA
jgi:hypothetical protein